MGISVFVALSVVDPGILSIAAIDIKTGYGYVLWVIWATGLLVSAALGISAGLGFKEDPTRAKLQIAGAVLIPIILSVLQYIFENVLKVKISASDSLSWIMDVAIPYLT